MSITTDLNETTTDYTVNITSQSEVDIIYSIGIENLPSGVNIALDEGNTTADMTLIQQFRTAMIDRNS